MVSPAEATVAKTVRPARAVVSLIYAFIVFFLAIERFKINSLKKGVKLKGPL